MTFSLFKIFTVLICTLLITACNNQDKKNKESETDQDRDTLSIVKNSFLFLTEWFDKVGVFKYELEKKKYSPVWWHPRENVVLLVYKPGELPAYFFTAEKIWSRGSLPSFSRLKLFLISHDLSEIKQIDDIGSGLQFTARWNDDDNLEVVFTSVDKTIASYVNQYKKMYDHYGRLVDSEIKTFDIQKSGFPQLVPPRNSTISPSGRYGLSIKADSVFVKTTGSESLKFVTIMNHNLNKIKWSEDEKYLFLSTLDLNNETIKSRNPETSELIIYSLKADTLIETFRGAGLKNFLIMDNTLVFDDGFDNNSVISIYDLKQKRIIGVIKPRVGCGLQVMPTLSNI